MPSVAGASAAPRAPRAPKYRASGGESLHDGLGDEVRLRLGLQRRAVHNLRRHVQRATVRLSVLLAADLLTFVMLRGTLRAVRDRAMLGETASRVLAEVMPSGALSGWQIAAALVLSLLVTGNYAPGDNRRDAGRLFTGCALAVALPLWMKLWTGTVGLVLLQYVLSTIVVWLGLTAERLTIDRIVATVRPPERDAVRAVFVGPAEQARRAARAPVFASGKEYRTVGFVDTAESGRESEAPEVVANVTKLIHEMRAEVVVICGPFRDPVFLGLVDTALETGCELISVPRTLNIAGVRPTMVWRGGEPLVTLTAPALKAQQLFIKRVVDIVCAALGLFVLSPLLAVLAVLVKLDSRGPAFFRQQRVGYGGRIFGVVKFRTMVADADAQKDSLAHLNQTGDERLFKIPDDPRVTRAGRWLRRWSLDELPQLWNVVMGEMSLVGPRPFFPSDLKHYEDHHFDRLGAKPGITGLWQVSGRSAVVDFEEVVRFDREYIENWSLGLDVKILLRTIPAVVTRHGAY